MVFHALGASNGPGEAVFMLILALMAIQAASNLVNSYVDFKKGLDQVDTAGDRTLVDQLVTTSTLQAGSCDRDPIDVR